MEYLNIASTKVLFCCLFLLGSSSYCNLFPLAIMHIVCGFHRSTQWQESYVLCVYNNNNNLVIENYKINISEFEKQGACEKRRVKQPHPICDSTHWMPPWSISNMHKQQSAALWSLSILITQGDCEVHPAKAWYHNESNALQCWTPCTHAILYQLSLVKLKVSLITFVLLLLWIETNS